ncbi:MAG TPA: TetR/AcrR family transcriptional regulator [Candidatus Acidoferrales bacterium]|nr:TetR/AcrR family transcriptional regulator [Candidatus Acidoferrales bacterium]
MARGRRRVEDPATARRILAAAEQHFAAQGLAGARTEEIAMAAHANKAMLYYYFGNKRRLHRAVLENLLRQLRAAVFSVLQKSLSPGERFFAGVSGYFDFLATHPNYPRLVQRQVMEPGRGFEWMVTEFFRPLHREFARTVEEAVAQGEFRSVDPDQTALITLQMTTSYFAAAAIQSRVVGRDLLAPEAVAARKRALLDFLRHAVARHGANTR